MPKTQLMTAQLGITGLEITRIGFGAGALGGGGWEFGWGSQDDQESITAIHHGPEQGVNWIDTAPAYGLGRSEQVVGRALEGLREPPYVFTKCSLLEGAGRRVVHSLKRGSVRREAIRERLGLEVIDVYQIHWPIPAEDIEEGVAALVERKEQGLVRHIGVSNFDVEELLRVQQIAAVETLQPPYSLIARNTEPELLPTVRTGGDRRDGLRSMGSGLLTGKMTRERIESLLADDWRKHDERCQEPQLSRHLAPVERLTAAAARHEATSGAVAVAWTLRHPAVDGAIVGFRRPDQVDPILMAAGLELSDDEVAEIEGG